MTTPYSTEMPTEAEPFDVDSLDFFHGDALIADPYPILARMRTASPVLREPVYGVMVVTGTTKCWPSSAIPTRSRRVTP